MSAALKFQNPAKRHPPSARDQEIYRLCKAQRVKQKDLAPQFGIKPPRVSQIVKQVGAWIANASAKDGELDCNQERRLERRIERARLEHLYGYSLRMLEDFEKPAESTREGAKGTEKTTREERNARVQALKSAIRTAESLGRIAEREPLPEPALKGTSGFIRFDHLQQELIRRRTLAEERGKAPASGEAYDVIWFLLRMLEGDPVKPIKPGSPLQAAMRKIVETLVEAGAGGQESGDRGQETGGGCVVAATTQGGARERGRESIAATDFLSGQRQSQLTPDPGAGGGAKETKLAGYALLEGCAADVLETIVASGWLERFKDGGEMHQQSLLAASLARENSGDFSAAGESVAAPDQEQRDVGWVQSAERTPTHAEEAGPEPRGSAPAAGLTNPTAAGIDVVGSPEWQVARAKWLKERDARVARERMQKIQERNERDEDLRQRRAAAAARNRWLEAGRCEY